MENNNKYYPPKIEEFYPGFEYEVMIPEKQTWSKETFYLNDSHINFIKYVDIQNEFTKNKIRVKYLDKEDIESLGFILKHKSIDLWFEKPGITLREDGYHLKNIKLNYGIHDQKLKIVFDYTSGETQVHFEGKIKNKSEFKKILKQLGITND
jgi:hypothetical protein